MRRLQKFFPPKTFQNTSKFLKYKFNLLCGKHRAEKKCITITKTLKRGKLHTSEREIECSADKKKLKHTTHAHTSTKINMEKKRDDKLTAPESLLKV